MLREILTQLLEEAEKVSSERHLNLKWDELPLKADDDTFVRLLTREERQLMVLSVDRIKEFQLGGKNAPSRLSREATLLRNLMWHAIEESLTLEYPALAICRFGKLVIPGPSLRERVKSEHPDVVIVVGVSREDLNPEMQKPINTKSTMH